MNAAFTWPARPNSSRTCRRDKQWLRLDLKRTEPHRTHRWRQPAGGAAGSLKEQGSRPVKKLDGKERAYSIARARSLMATGTSCSFPRLLACCRLSIGIGEPPGPRRRGTRTHRHRRFRGPSSRAAARWAVGPWAWQQIINATRIRNETTLRLPLVLARSLARLLDFLASDRHGSAGGRNLA